MKYARCAEERIKTMISESLKGKIAVVTGGIRGIGRACALRLAESGADIAIFDMGSPEAGEATAQEIRALGVRALALRCDITDADAIKAALGEVRAQLGRVDILVNNAGITRDGLAMRMRDEDFDAVINTNLKGAFLMSRAVMSDMVGRRSGRIVNMASVAGEMGNAGQANYSSAKAGLIGLTKTLARELASRGITVNAVAPGFVETSMTAAMNADAREKGLELVPLGRMAQPEEIAEAVCFLASDRAAYITGVVLNVNGGMYM